jgi:catechol-2,3-dioxygenase
MYSSSISELVLVVKDVRSSARFYEEVVGLMPEKEADGEWAWFWAGRDPTHSLAIGTSALRAILPTTRRRTLGSRALRLRGSPG